MYPNLYTEDSPVAYWKTKFVDGTKEEFFVRGFGAVAAALGLLSYLGYQGVSSDSDGLISTVTLAGNIMMASLFGKVSLGDYPESTWIMRGHWLIHLPILALSGKAFLATH